MRSLGRFLCWGVAAGAIWAAQVPDSKPSKLSPGDAVRGKAVFQNHCEECHDAYSKDEKVGPGLLGAKNGKLPDGRAATHDKLLDIINTGPAEMPSFRDRISEQEKEDVVAFVMTL